MRFKKPKMIARDLGRLFGESSHKINQWLENAGLRDSRTKNPTLLARNEGYSAEIWNEGYPQQAWIPQKVLPKFVEHGHPLVIDLPSDLVEPVQLIGPFQSRDRSILNAENDRIAFVSSPENAKFVCRVLNIAYNTGLIDRCFFKGKQDETSERTT